MQIAPRMLSLVLHTRPPAKISAGSSAFLSIYFYSRPQPALRGAARTAVLAPWLASARIWILCAVVWFRIMEIVYAAGAESKKLCFRYVAITLLPK
ncbi:hypothetical protein B0H12DRAFT_793808 [Mycena haematopus]|nr:hypothetical protein B0H12DRAFT_793808 [Mycena haematopus]